MTTVFEVLNKAGVSAFRNRYDGFAGVEIETETNSAYHIPDSRFWDVKEDGSLRNFGREYVLRGPMSDRELVAALDEFATFNKKFKFNKNSISTSVHVHLNMLNETFLTVANLVVAWTLMENLLIKFSGPDRYSNLFCLPIRDAKGVTEGIFIVLRALSLLRYREIKLPPEQYKYGAINLCPLTKLGTVEIRCFRGDTDSDVIYEWIDVLRALVTYAKRQGQTPIRIMEEYHRREHGLVHEIFPEHGVRLTKGMTNQQVDQMIVGPDGVNLISAGKFATVVSDWTNFGMPKPKKITTEVYKQRLDDLAMGQYGVLFSNLNFPQRVVVQDMFQQRNMNARIVDINEDR